MGPCACVRVPVFACEYENMKPESAVKKKKKNNKRATLCQSIAVHPHLAECEILQTRPTPLLLACFPLKTAQREEKKLLFLYLWR